MDSTAARRSSRANRASQPLPSTTSQHSSASSISSGRADRATRSNLKTESPRKSTPPGSLSPESPDDPTAPLTEDTIQTRRKRSRADERDKAVKAQPIQVEIINGVEELDEDNEAVRCICGLEDYPGPPQLNEEDNKHGVRQGIEEPIISPTDVPEELSGFFLQCDECKVWQHGGCVGIMNEEQSPEEYFCEQCRKDLHKIFITPAGYVLFSNFSQKSIFFVDFDPTPTLTRERGADQVSQGWLLQVWKTPTKTCSKTIPFKYANMMDRRQHYSHYLPLYQSLSRTTSRAASFSKDGTRSPRGSKNGRPSSSLQSAKRRSTMNSRATYDEEEQLRLAIEASRDAKEGESADESAIRPQKRGRSESEE